MKRESKYENDLVEKVRKAMGWKSRAKALRWFATDNPLLGGLSPDDLLDEGLERELAEFIECLPVMH